MSFSGWKVLIRVLAGEEIYKHYSAEQWIVIELLLDSRQPYHIFSQATVEKLNDICIQLIQKSQKRAFIMLQLVPPEGDQEEEEC